MSNEYWLKDVFGSEEPAELIKEVAGVANKLAQACGDIRSTRECAMEASILRNAAIAGTDCESLTATWAGADLSMMQVLGTTADDVIDAAGKADGIRRALSKLFVVIGQKVVALDQRVKAYERRLKEHATNNSSLREEVFNSTGGLCFYCETQMWDAMFGPTEGMDPSKAFHIDHIVPKTHGGPDHLSNYIPACARCNMSKGDRSFLEFVKKRSTKLRVINGGQE
jgi:5-methylcytosine-specific restriction endonuclease McrA